MTNSRKTLVREYNRALGGGKFPKEWSCKKVKWIVDSYISDRGQLPPLDREVFKSRSGYCPYYPMLLAAIYMAGIYTDKFPFAMNAYGKVFGCNPNTINRLMRKLISLGIVSILTTGKYVTPTPDGKHPDGKSNWYQLNNPESLLNLYLFPTDTERIQFARFFGSMKNKFSDYRWGDYVIRPNWLYQNFLM